MTHPDPYVEEVMSKLDELPTLGYRRDYVHKDNAKELLRTALETQKSATKTQRIKDIEEIEARLKKERELFSGRGDWEYGFINCVEIISELLTSRKAAIEEV